MSRILVGRFGAPHGVKGEVRLKSFTADPRAIADYAPLLDSRGAGVVITALRHVKDDMFVARIAGVDRREAAEALTHTELFIARENLPDAGEEEFYQADLIGLAAVTESGEALGEVVDVLNFGGGDILELKPAAGGETLLLPFTRAVVPIVDVKAGRLVVAPPAEADETDPANAREPSPDGSGRSRPR